MKVDLSLRSVLLPPGLKTYGVRMVFGDAILCSKGSEKAAVVLEIFWIVVMCAYLDNFPLCQAL